MRVIEKLPKISFIVMTLNGGEIFERLLRSIRNQNYPQNKIEIVVVDDGSTDNTVLFAKKNKAKVIISGKHDMYLSWGIALKNITGDFVYMVDQDMILRGRDFVKKMLKPMLEDQTIAGSITRFYPKSDQTLITRYLSYHPSQCDPLFEYLVPSITDTIVEERKDYSLLNFKLEKIPGEPRMMYRVSSLKKSKSWGADRIFDHDLLVCAVKAGYNNFAYVPEAGLYHYHAKNLSHLISKRIRNMKYHYFPYQNTLEYRWVDSDSNKTIPKLLLWVLYANLFFPATIRGIYRAIQYKSLDLLMEPVVTIATTDAVVFYFLKNKVGRQIIQRSLESFINR